MALSAGANAAQAVHKDATASEDDIIQRDEQGNYRLDLPSMAPLPRDEDKEEHGENNTVSIHTSVSDIILKK
jgi:hypothetical protein